MPISVNASRLVSIGQYMQAIQKTARAGERANIPPAQDKSLVMDALDAVREAAETMGMTVTLAIVKDAVDQLREPSVTYDHIASRALAINTAFDSELQQRGFLCIFPDKVAFFNHSGARWTSALTRFAGANGLKSIRLDVEEADRCFALDRATATVFHLMRIVEVGVQELGMHLRFAKAPSVVWDTIMKAVGDAIEKLPVATLAERQQKLALQGLVPYLDSVRRVWRNPVMHPMLDYTIKEAGEISAAVRIFMEHLAGVI